MDIAKEMVFYDMCGSADLFSGLHIARGTCLIFNILFTPGNNIYLSNYNNLMSKFDV